MIQIVFTQNVITYFLTIGPQQFYDRSFGEMSRDELVVIFFIFLLHNQYKSSLLNFTGRFIAALVHCCSGTVPKHYTMFLMYRCRNHIVKDSTRKDIQ